VGGTVLVGKGLDLMPTLIMEMKSATNGAEFVLATLVGSHVLMSCYQLGCWACMCHQLFSNRLSHLHSQSTLSRLQAAFRQRMHGLHVVRHNKVHHARLTDVCGLHVQVYVGITIILSIFLFSYVLAILAHVSFTDEGQHGLILSGAKVTVSHGQHNFQQPDSFGTFLNCIHLSVSLPCAVATELLSAEAQGGQLPSSASGKGCKRCQHL
jgi:hypothetical protein